MDDNSSPEPTFFYRFVRQFEYLIGNYFLPISIFLEGGKAIHTGVYKAYFLFIGFFLFELTMWVLKESKGTLKKVDIKNLNFSIWLFQIYTITSGLIALQTLAESFTLGSYLLIMPVIFASKYLILKRVSNQL